MRSLYLVAYDVCDDRRLRRAHRLVKAHAVGGQKSVFECWLSDAERNMLWRRSAELLRAPPDRFFLLRLDPRMSPLLIGRARPVLDPRLFYQG